MTFRKWLDGTRTRTNIGKNLCAGDVYAAVGKSHTAVDRAFHAQLGTSVKQMIMRIRLEEAKHLIQDTDLPFAQVMKRSGFATAQHFCHTITAAFGRSPTALRANRAAR